MSEPTGTYPDPLLRAFSDAVKAMNRQASLDDVLRAIARAGREITDARYGALAVLNPEGGIDQFVTDGLSEAELAAMSERPRGRGLLGAVLTGGRPIRVPDISSDPRSYGFPANHPHMRSFLGVPIKLAGSVIGNLYLASKQSAPEFTREDEWIATLLAEHAAIAVEQARLARAREAFISIAAHELRTPISGARLAIETALEGTERARLPSDVLELLREVERYVSELADETEELLDFSRLERGVLRLHRSTVDMRDICTAACERMAWTYGARRIHAKLGEAPLIGRWDHQRVRRAITNVLENALRYSPAGSQAGVALEADDRRARVIVRDRGPGIPPEALERIWKPFTRGPAARSDHRGAGIGLFVVREIVEAHGGQVHMDSRVGVGTTVVLELPCRPTPADPD